ncbi:MULTISPECIES: hypothetical protein [unclassified Butyrivibrio]|uniref:hypothetical protein n=1 Tax=unclassified Butyrivibrio TaxID=2639466 RepID=UPI0008DECDCC|nr:MULTISPECIES: hypothetical protein [unclassified Butyrivibrio]MBR4668973.1 hypothetical protein [Butyrivibrio sp.]RKM58620.1 hypothetical protein D6856_12775 [Butyrivibrio sp. XB500-5]SFU60239.1 hypothetical protein SAMN02910342_01093 [Butyrivibrio sp. INlla21]
MTKTVPLSKTLSIDQLNHLIDTGHVYVTPFGLNRTAYIVVNHKPFMVITTDISINGIQLSGAWYTWEDIEAMGGVYESEFDALKAIANGI